MAKIFRRARGTIVQAPDCCSKMAAEPFSHQFSIAQFGSVVLPTFRSFQGWSGIRCRRHVISSAAGHFVKNF